MIDTKNLTYFYSDENTLNDTAPHKLILDNITLHIDKGSFTCILGHNGSGKSTLAKHFNAILLPCGGKVYVDGMDTADEKLLFNIRANAGMVFQNPDNQIVTSIVEDEVAFAPENLGIPPDEIRKRVDAALEAVHMSEYANHSVTMLSGGQKQRVAIASVLAMQPQCIILDEPTAMLDPMGRADVTQTIKSLNRSHNITVVLITHFMDEAAQADRVIVTDHGKVILDDTARKVFLHADLLGQVGLELPQPTELAAELANRGIDIRRDVLTVDECVNEILRILGDTP